MNAHKHKRQDSILIDDKNQRMKVLKYKFIFIFLLIFLSDSVMAQSIVEVDSSKIVKFNDTARTIIIHAANSKLPDTIYVQAQIIGISLGNCGIFCIGGVIKARLHEEIEGYSDTLVYLVTACLADGIEIEKSLILNVKTMINVKASKLTRLDNECYYKTIRNIFDSKQTPFYKLSENETGKIHL